MKNVGYCKIMFNFFFASNKILKVLLARQKFKQLSITTFLQHLHKNVNVNAHHYVYNLIFQT